ncbi:DUF4260 domain-containing protein [Solibacillus cecembensis]|uniref:DUF4260 domain-containing protein n=1 Tax=Solibacillus cecembensis TaxID=459347 RepID=UPI0007173CBE
MIKLFIRVEYGIAFLLLLFIYMRLDFSLWLFFILLLVPDLTMVGYAMNKKIGAVIYNFGHTLIIPFLLLIVSFSSSNELVVMFSLIWTAHILMDRCFGFGLKYEDTFKNTHLQRI